MLDDNIRAKLAAFPADVAVSLVELLFTVETLKSEKTQLLLRIKGYDSELERNADEIGALKRSRDALVGMYNAELERCGEFLKEDETPSQCIKRNREDANALLGMLAAERKKVEAMKDEIENLKHELNRLNLELRSKP